VTRVSAADFNAKIVMPLVRWLLDRRGPEELRAVLAAAGLSEDEVDGKNRWISQQQFEAFLERARERMASDDEFRAACVHRLAEGYGAVRFVLRAMTPRAVFALAQQTYRLVARVGKMEVLSSSPTEMRARFTSDRPISRLLCTVRQAQSAAFPTLWGLPPATLTESSCIARGDASCDFHLRYFTRTSGLTILAGVIAGGVLAAAAAGGGLGEPLALASLTVFGAVAGLAVEQRRAERANVAAAEDQRRALRAIAEEAAEARRELARDERARAFGTLAATLAQELEGPLAALRAALAGEDTELLEVARREVPRLAALNEGLRDLGRAEQPRLVELAAASLGHAAESVRPAAAARGVTLEIEPCDPEARVRGDPWQLARAVQTLVRRAVQATPGGGRVRAAVRRVAGDLEVVIEDDVRGRTTPGMDLARFVVQRIAEVHGGSVAFASFPETGTRVTVRIPAAPIAPAADDLGFPPNK
jgi:signal transduction histidine kinase